MQKTDILFDLDGTLTDPAEGITGSVAYALEKLGIQPPPRKQLECFIGPPLNEAFTEYYNLSPGQISQAVTWFREYFERQGILENKLFPDIPQLLASLKAQGRTLHVATSKPTSFALQILQHFNLAQYFDIVEGSPLSHNGLPKAEVVQAVLARGGIAPASAVMVGDRKHDIIGAHHNGLTAVGVLYGFGSRAEHQAAGADYIAEDIPALQAILHKM